MKRVAIIFAAGFLVRAVLIAVEPIIFGGDTILRLVNHERIVVSYQLPLLQILIHYLCKLTLDPMAARIAMSLIGAAVGIAFYYLARHFVDERHAYYAALFCAVHPFLLGLSTVPYQEPLMLATLFFAFHFLLSGRSWESSLALGLACLTRYEAWAACPVFAAEYMLRRRPGLSVGWKAVLLFGWAPIAWLLYNGGLSAQGSFVLEGQLTIARLVRYVYLGWITVKFTPLPILLLGLAGLWYVIRTTSLWPVLRAPAAFVALFLIAILFSAHGVDPDPERFVTSREACVLMASVLLLAAIGLSRMSRWKPAAVIVSLLWGVLGSYLYLRGEVSKPELKLSYSLAQRLDTSGHSGGKVLILARHTPRKFIEYYLDRAYQAGGERARDAAKSELEQVRLEPIYYLRTLVHTRHSRQRLVGIPALRFWRTPPPIRTFPAVIEIDCLAIWSDYSPADDSEAAYVKELLPRFAEAETLRENGLSVVIHRKRSR